MNAIIMAAAQQAIVAIVKQLVTEENMKFFGDKLFDFIEDAVMSSKTTIDDVSVLPVINALRSCLNIPDNDEACK